jgi:phosphate/sulfate permease
MTEHHGFEERSPQSQPQHQPQSQSEFPSSTPPTFSSQPIASVGFTPDTVRSQWQTSTKYFIALVLTSALGFVSAAIFFQSYNYFSLQRQKAETKLLNQAETYYQQENFDRCLEITQQFPFHPYSIRLAERCQTELDREKLREVNRLAGRGQLAAAIALVREVSTPELLNQVQQLTLKISQRMVELMEEAYQAGDMSAVTHIAGAIDANNPLYEAAQSRFREMQQQWQEHQAWFRSAQILLNHQHLSEAIETIQLMTHPYWQTQAQPLLNEANQRRKELENIIQQAKAALANDDPDSALDWINLLPQIEPWLNEKNALHAEARTLKRRQVFSQALSIIAVFSLFLALIVIK